MVVSLCMFCSVLWWTRFRATSLFNQYVDTWIDTREVIPIIPLVFCAKHATNASLSPRRLSELSQLYRTLQLKCPYSNSTRTLWGILGSDCSRCFHFHIHIQQLQMKTNQDTVLTEQMKLMKLWFKSRQEFDLYWCTTANSAVNQECYYNF